MASWPTGIETIRGLIAANSLQKVAPSREAAEAMLDAAAKHLASAQLVAESDPDGAYALLYDAARKSLAAVLQAQGLRSTTRGGHYAIQEAISAQFTKPPPLDAFGSFGRLRRNRNQIEYNEISPITAEDIAADEPAVRALHTMARQLVEVLPVFVD
jgi:YD repeat-containing protein